MIFLIVEIIGTIAFAVSGAMAAMKRKLDILGVIFIGVVTACGGGFLRDVLLHHEGVANLFVDPTYVIISALVSFIMFTIFFIIKDNKVFKSRWYRNILTFTDAVGLGMFIVIGANETIKQGYDKIFIVVFMSTLTAVGGGMIRDILVNKIPNIFIKHIYAVPAIIGSILYFVLPKTGVYEIISPLLIISFIIVIRMVAYKYELSLPKVNFKE